MTRTTLPKRTAPRALIRVGLALTAWLVVGQALAQQPSAKTRSTASLSKEDILTSPEWQEAESAYARWLRQQNLYSEEQIAAFHKEWRASVEQMSAEELAGMFNDMQVKLQILLSPEARDANAYVGQYMAVAAQKKVDEMRSRAPNLVDASPEELEQRLQDFQSRRGARRAAQSQFDRTRQQQVDQQLAANRAAVQNRAAADRQRMSRAPQPSYQSSYAPKKPAPRPSKGPVYSVGPLGGVTTYYGGYRW